MRYHTSRHSFKCFTLFKYCGFPSNSMFEYFLTYFPSYSRSQILNALDIIWNFTSVSYLQLTYGQDWHPDYEKRRYYCDIIREPDYRASTLSEHHPSAMTHIHNILNLNVAEFFRGYIKYKLGDVSDLNEAYNQFIDNEEYLVAYCLYAFYHPENSNITSTFTYNAFYNPDHTNIDNFLNKMYRHNLQ
jgi:hypothetical protein